jgi:hypothetical protein
MALLSSDTDLRESFRDLPDGVPTGIREGGFRTPHRRQLRVMRVAG